MVWRRPIGIYVSQSHPLSQNSTSSFFLKLLSTYPYRPTLFWNVLRRCCDPAEPSSALRQISTVSETWCIWHWGTLSLTIFDIRKTKPLFVMCLNIAANISVGSFRRPDSHDAALNTLRCTTCPQILSIGPSLSWAIRCISFLAGGTI